MHFNVQVLLLFHVCDLGLYHLEGLSLASTDSFWTKPGRRHLQHLWNRLGRGTKRIQVLCFLHLWVSLCWRNRSCAIPRALVRLQRNVDSPHSHVVSLPRLFDGKSAGRWRHYWLDSRHLRCLHCRVQILQQRQSQDSNCTHVLWHHDHVAMDSHWTASILFLPHSVQLQVGGTSILCQMALLRASVLGHPVDFAHILVLYVGHDGMQVWQVRRIEGHSQQLSRLHTSKSN